MCMYLCTYMCVHMHVYTHISVWICLHVFMWFQAHCYVVLKTEMQERTWLFWRITDFLYELFCEF